MRDGLVKVEDSHPKDGLLAPPLVVASLVASEPETVAPDQVRVAFRAVVKDAQGRRCPDLAVDATIAGPTRTASGTATTDLMGAVRFRMTGPAGSYHVTIDGVAAGALAWDADASVTTATITATA